MDEPIVVHENDIELYLEQFQIDHNIPDLRAASQSVWNACLMYICRHVFKGTDKLKSKVIIGDGETMPKTNFNSYDYELVNQVCDYYIALCMLYDKEVSIIGFSNLTGISYDSVYEWANHPRLLSEKSFEIYKKLHDFREESLSSKLATGNKNPVGVLAILNRHYQWNLPGVSRENTATQKLTAADLPQLGNRKTVEIPENVSE